MKISDYRKKLEAQCEQQKQSLLSKARTHQLDELRYEKGILDGVSAALRLIDELEKIDG